LSSFFCWSVCDFWCSYHLWPPDGLLQLHELLLILVALHEHSGHLYTCETFSLGQGNVVIFLRPIRNKKNGYVIRMKIISTVDSRYSEHHLQQHFVHNIKRFTISRVTFSLLQRNTYIMENVHYIEMFTIWNIHYIESRLYKNELTLRLCWPFQCLLSPFSAHLQDLLF